MKSILSAHGLMVISLFASAQTTSPDFTAVDCDGTSHNLYSELNSGKTVILSWVMPCCGCIHGTLVADSTVEALSAQSSNGILLWIIDDGPPSDCAYVEDWVSDLGLKKQIVFGNYNNEINQDLWGGPGMPHIVVVGPDKYIYYNGLNSVGTGLYAAAENAMNTTLDIKSIESNLLFSISPNPVTEAVSITAGASIEKVQLISLSGQLLKEDHSTARQTYVLQLEGITPGTYTLKVTDSAGNEGIQKIIKP